MTDFGKRKKYFGQNDGKANSHHPAFGIFRLRKKLQNLSRTIGVELEPVPRPWYQFVNNGLHY